MDADYGQIKNVVMDYLGEFGQPKNPTVVLNPAIYLKMHKDTDKFNSAKELLAWIAGALDENGELSTPKILVDPLVWILYFCKDKNTIHQSELSKRNGGIVTQTRNIKENK